MFSGKIIKEITKGDIIQVISQYWNGGVGQIHKITDDYIILIPIEDTPEEYQSITHEVILPLDDVKVIIKVNKEEIPKND